MNKRAEFVGEVDAREAEAVLKVIEAETEAFYNKDFEALSRCWVHAPYVRRLGWWTRGGVTDRTGWDEIESRHIRLMADNPKPNVTALEIRRENVNVRVGKDMAWVTFDQYAPDTGEPDMDMPGLSRETRVLEKHDGQWRIAYLGYIHHTPGRYRAPMLRADRDGRVSWMSRAARKLVDSAEHLELRAGRLRAVGPAASKRLQAAIAQMASADDWIDGGGDALPVVVDSEAGEEICVCWISTDGSGSGTVTITVNDLDYARDRLDDAAVVYGLSLTQQRLAEQIVAGQNLVNVATHLGISVTTARTHLQRVFEKTGVRSQPALVRALLSAASPVSA